RAAISATAVCSWELANAGYGVVLRHLRSPAGCARRDTEDCDTSGHRFGSAHTARVACDLGVFGISLRSGESVAKVCEVLCQWPTGTREIERHLQRIPGRGVASGCGESTNCGLQQSLRGEAGRHHEWRGRQIL